MISIKGIIDKVASRKLGVTAVGRGLSGARHGGHYLAGGGYSGGLYPGASCCGRVSKQLRGDLF